MESSEEQNSASESETNEKKPLLGGEAKGWNISSRFIRTLKWRLIYNLFMVSLVYGISGLGYGFYVSTQTSINYKDGIGAATLAVMTTTAILGCFLINPIQQKLGCRWSVVLGNAFLNVAILMNLYPRWYTLMPVAVICGFSGSLQLVPFRTFVAQLAQRYCSAQNCQNQSDEIQSRMFMVNIFVFKFVLGVVYPFTSVMLGLGNDASSSDQMAEVENYTGSHCGANYCNEGFGQMRNGTLDEEPDFSVVVKVVSFCVACCTVASIILILLVDSSESLGISNEMIGRKKKKLFPISTMLKPRMLMLIPTFIVMMSVDIFWTMDFPAAFITCNLGIEYIGLVMMWVGVSGAVSCLIFGSINSEKFRKIPISLSIILQIGILIGLILWPATSNVFVVLCLITAAWYMGSGIRITLMPALIAVVFPDELLTAYSIMTMWNLAGTLLVTIWSGWICMYVKLYVLTVLLALSLVGYAALEIDLAREKKRQQLVNNMEPDEEEEENCNDLICYKAIHITYGH